MNSRIVEREVKGFPKLMITRRGLIVLFSSEEDGVVVQNGSLSDGIDGINKIGYSCDNWDLSCFRDFNGAIVETEVKKKGFPKLMISNLDGTIVLFSFEKEGVVLHQGDKDSHILGFHTKNWKSSCFRDFNDELILEN